MFAIGLGRFAIIVTAAWICVIFYISAVWNGPYETENDRSVIHRNERQEAVALDSVLAQLSQIQSRLDELQKEKLQLWSALNRSESLRRAERLNVQENGGNKRCGQDCARKIGSEHERLRRFAVDSVREFWYYVSGELRKAFQDGLTHSNLNEILENGAQLTRSIKLALTGLGNSDGASEWKRQEMQNLTRVVQDRLYALQHPKDCTKSKRLVCKLNKGCGYGCQIHHVVYCMLVAMGTGRTLVLNTKFWRYSNKGWSSVFLPVSSCSEDDLPTSQIENWKGELEQKDVLAVALPIVDVLSTRPPYLPLSFPAEISKDLLLLHGFPPAWWIGQIVHYLTRPQPQLKLYLENLAKRLNYEDPIVGVHVRRTDKVGGEAQLHTLSEYMVWVDNYYMQLEMSSDAGLPNKRRVYLATDEPSLFAEARAQFPNYAFIGSEEIAALAQVERRYSDDALWGIIADIHFLSRTDYLVCTFSSQVCRMAYELMQTYHSDAADSFHSLDDIYYFGGQDARQQIVTFPHKPQRKQRKNGSIELALEVGDVVGVAGNHWDGWSKGRNVRTGQVGLYPSWKVKEKWRIVPFSKFFAINPLVT